MFSFDWTRSSNSTPVKQLNSLTNVNSRSEEHTSELQSLMRISYAVFCLKKKIYTISQLYTPDIYNKQRYRHIQSNMHKQTSYQTHINFIYINLYIITYY